MCACPVARWQLTDLQAKSFDAWKSAQRARTDAAVAAITATATAAEATAVATGRPALLVETLDVGDDGKLAGRLVSALTKACPHVGVMVVHGAEDRVVAVCGVPDGVVAASGVKANAWVAAAVAAAGGRGGGKDGTAQGQAPSPANVHAIVAAAKAFVEGKGAAV